MTEFTTLFLAMQGAFAEHQAMFQKLSPKKSVAVLLVRTPEELARCDALVIPGGGKPHLCPRPRHQLMYNVP